MPHKIGLAPMYAAMSSNKNYLRVIYRFRNMIEVQCMHKINACSSRRCTDLVCIKILLFLGTVLDGDGKLQMSASKRLIIFIHVVYHTVRSLALYTLSA